MKLVIDIGDVTPEQILAAMGERTGYPFRLLTLGYQVFEVSRVEQAPEPAALTFDPAVTCAEPVPDPDGADELVPCRTVSRFVVSRSDGDTRYGDNGTGEACEAHLPEVVAGMLGGDEDVSAVVTIRWDAAGSGASSD